MAKSDKRLAALIDGWERLPEPLRAAVLGMVQAAAGKPTKPIPPGALRR
ncbi:MAG: hypothetical protein ACP5QA_12085 [Phycisphaerae bacterium]